MTDKLMKLKQYSDGASYWRVACDCHSPDHDVTLWFEPEPGVELVNLNLSMEVGFFDKHYGGFSGMINNLTKRVRHAAKVLFTGYATMQGDVVLDEAGIKAMQAALKQGIAHAQAAKAARLRKD